MLDGHPIPDSGDLRRDLHHYLTDQWELLTTPGARAVLGRLIAETAGDDELARELDERLVQPRLAQFRDRLDVAVAAGQLPPGTDTRVLADLVVGPVWFEALVTGRGADVDALLDSALPHPVPGGVPGPGRVGRG